jgi:glucan-binding YG repeat protein
MKFRKTLVMLLAACLLIGSIAGTALAAGQEDTGKVEQGIYDDGGPSGLIIDKPNIERKEDFIPAYEYAEMDLQGNLVAAGVIGVTVPYTGWWMFGDNWVYYRDGELQRHWQLIDGNWYYFNTYGFMVNNGVAWVDNRLYYFLPSGVCDTTPGWKTVYGPYYVFENTQWWIVYPIGSDTEPGGKGAVQPYYTYFYLNEYGFIQTGWNYIEGTWHMIDKDTGRVLCNEWYVGEGGCWYYFDENTDMATGWHTVSSQFMTDRTYYFADNGVCQWGWLNLNGNWYYLNPRNAARVENAWALIPDAKIGDWWYLFDENGVMQTGWRYRKTGNFVWIDENGRPLQGQPAPGQKATKADEIAWYYLASWGGMLSGPQFINGKWYLFADKDCTWAEEGELIAIWSDDFGGYWDYDLYDKATNYLVPGESQKEKDEYLAKLDYAN